MPVYNLFAAVWKVQSNRSADLSLVQKGVMMETAMGQALEYMKGCRARMKADNPVYAFLAPEYYWEKNGQHDLYSAGEKATIYNAIKQDSSSFSDMILFPGTISWQVPLSDHDGEAPANLKTKQFVGYNSTPVCLNAALLLDYDKKYNDGIVDRSTTTAFGRRRAAIHAKQDFQAKNLHFGVDICGDLNKGQLQMTLGATKIDVMALLSGFIDHRFNNDAMKKIPVRDGGAFVHADNTGTVERNGLWVVDRDNGWHGAHRIESVLEFRDLDNIARKIGFPTNSDKVPGNTMKVSAISGFGSLKDIDADVTEKSRGWVRQFSFTIPGGKNEQTAALSKAGDSTYSVKLTRKWARTKTRTCTFTTPDLTTGVTVTGRGNVSKIGKLLPGPKDPDLDCYSVPIVK